MPPLTDADIARIAHGLAARTLPKPEWTHTAHVAAALHLIAHHGRVHTLAHMPRMIRAYNTATRVPNTAISGYHETITLASIRAVAAHLAAHPGRNLHETCRDLLRTHLAHPSWPLAFWSPERLFTPAARRRWMPPDRHPLPF